MPVSDVRVKAVPITLDKDRNLKYDMNAFAEIEEKFGSVDEALKELTANGVKLKSIRYFVWVGLIHEDEQLTEKQVGSMFTFGDAAEVLSKAIESLNAALPHINEGAAKNK